MDDTTKTTATTTTSSTEVVVEVAPDTAAAIVAEDTITTPPKKRLGRPRKNSVFVHSQTTTNLVSAAAAATTTAAAAASSTFIQNDTDSTTKTAAAKANDDDDNGCNIIQVNVSAGTSTSNNINKHDINIERTIFGVTPLPNECRRSARKKIIKFDVLNLLNKNRKSAKQIQIEARIDSNAPPTATTIVPTGCSSSNLVNTLNKNVASSRSTVLNRRYSMFESVNPTKQLIMHPSKDTNIFLPISRPTGVNQNRVMHQNQHVQSLIVSQVTTTSTTALTPEKQLTETTNTKPIKVANSYFGPAAASNTQRKRGRPPKFKSNNPTKSSTNNDSEPVGALEHAAVADCVITTKQLETTSPPIVEGNGELSPCRNLIVNIKRVTIPENEPRNTANKKCLTEEEEETEQKTPEAENNDLNNLSPNIPSAEDKDIQIAQKSFKDAVLAQLEDNGSRDGSISESTISSSSASSIKALNNKTLRIRRSRRLSFTGLASNSLTLEEQFAEINAISSKEVLKQASIGGDTQDVDSESTDLTIKLIKTENDDSSELNLACELDQIESNLLPQTIVTQPLPDIVATSPLLVVDRPIEQQSIEIDIKKDCNTASNEEQPVFETKEQTICSTVFKHDKNPTADVVDNTANDKTASVVIPADNKIIVVKETLIESDALAMAFDRADEQSKQFRLREKKLFQKKRIRQTNASSNFKLETKLVDSRKERELNEHAVTVSNKSIVPRVSNVISKYESIHEVNSVENKRCTNFLASESSNFKEIKSKSEQCIHNKPETITSSSNEETTGLSIVSNSNEFEEIKEKVKSSNDQMNLSILDNQPKDKNNTLIIDTELATLQSKHSPKDKILLDSLTSTSLQPKNTSLETSTDLLIPTDLQSQQIPASDLLISTILQSRESPIATNSDSRVSRPMKSPITTMTSDLISSKHFQSSVDTTSSDKITTTTQENVLEKPSITSDSLTTMESENVSINSDISPSAVDTIYDSIITTEIQPRKSPMQSTSSDAIIDTISSNSLTSTTLQSKNLPISSATSDSLTITSPIDSAISDSVTNQIETVASKLKECLNSSETKISNVSESLHSVDSIPNESKNSTTCSTSVPPNKVTQKCSRKRKIRKSTGADVITETKSDASNINSPNLVQPPPTPPPSTIVQAEEKPTDPFKDIEKFIESSENLLKHDYKIDDDSVDSEIKSTVLPKVDVNAEFDERVKNLETPADSPVPTISLPSSPLNSSTASSPVPSEVCTTGVRRSHRIKQKPQAPRALVGRGVVRDGDCTVPHNIKQHLINLSQIETSNEQFLKTEGLDTFQMVRENYFKCVRTVSKEQVDMFCDCFLTAEEEANGQWGCGEGCINRMLMIECGPQCSNKDRCSNNRFQKQLCAPCRVFRTEKKGCGILADVQILPGDFVMEYVGEVIKTKEYDRRTRIYSRSKNPHYYFMSLTSDTYIDATNKGNISRFINHSCDPNAVTQKWTVNGEVRIGFFGLKPISPGEEITFDYKFERYGRIAQRCFCETSKCRGWLGKEPSSDDELYEDSDGDYDSEVAEDENSSEISGEDGNVNVAKDKRVIKASRKSDTIAKSRPKISDLARLSKIKPDHHKATQQQRKTDDSRSTPTASTSKKAAKRFENERRMRVLEDSDVQEELAMLNQSGLKNQANTLRFSRIMVRAKLLQTRLSLLSILQRGELPCRRLFLDYHGLRLLHGWMNENGGDLEFRSALLETLNNLPIPNKTVLIDTKIYQTLKNWKNNIFTPVTLNTQQTSQNDKATTTLKETELIQSSSNNTTEEKEKVEKHIDSLIVKWDALPDIFRIPKRERIEQMKEHEREANRQSEVPAPNENLTVTPLESDRYKRDRFGRDTSSRYVKPSAINSNISTISVIKDGKHTQGNGMGLNTSFKMEAHRRRESTSSASSYDRTKYLPKEVRRELFEKQVARGEAAKRKAEENRIFEINCNFFGFDMALCDPSMLPVSENLFTGEFFNAEGQLIPRPPRCGDQPPAPPSQSTDAEHYELPDTVKTLPLYWTFSITPEGYLYFINLLDQTTQWEPPSFEQRKQMLHSTSESESDTQSDESIVDAIVEIDANYAASLNPEQLREYITEKAKERRQKRYEQLVSVCEISPRREEDRMYNQFEARKYKENKDKIRRRKEEYKRRRIEHGNTTAVAAIEKSNLSDDMLYNDMSRYKPYKSLPIMDYLYSSDEVSEIDAGPQSPMNDMIMPGDKIVDELDVLNSRRHLKRQQPLSPLDMEPSTSRAAANKLRSLPLPPLPPLPPLSNVFEQNFSKGGGGGSALNNDLSSATLSPMFQRNLPQLPVTAAIISEKNAATKDINAFTVRNNSNNSSSIIDSFVEDQRMEYKRRRVERDKRKAGNYISSSAKDKFRNEIAQTVVEFLKPYRKDSCSHGRITNEQDFHQLARRLTHYVMTKEIKYCESIGQSLLVNESVKHKTRGYIKVYMQKYGKVYKRPENDSGYGEVRIPS